MAHRPLLAYALSWLRDAGIGDAAVCANRETQVLESRLHRHVPDGLRVSYHEDSMPRGAAGAVKDAAAGSDAELFIVTDGNSIPNVDLSTLLAAHQLSGAAATVVTHVEAGRHHGAALHTPTGIYVFNRQVLEHIPATGFCDIKETLIPQLHRTNLRVNAYKVDVPSPRVLDAASYRAVNEWMVEHLVSTRTIPEGYVLSGTALVHRDASIARDATLVGPVLIGPGASVGSGAVIVGPTSIGRDAVIGEGVLVSRSAIWRRCVLREKAVADGCILGDDTVIPAATHVVREILSQPRLDAPQTYEAPAVPENVSFELLRRIARMVFGGTTLDRYPATQ